MSACEQCGEENAPGTDFCTSCGAFLVWTAAGESVVKGPAPAEPGEAAVAGDAPADGAPTTDSGPVPGPSPDGEAGDEQAQPATVGTRPGAGPGTAAQAQPAATGPDRPPAPPRPQAHPPPPPAPVGFVVCATCRKANPPERRYCPACGTNLAVRPPPAKRAWWRRFWPAGRATPIGEPRVPAKPSASAPGGRISAAPARAREAVAGARRARGGVRRSIAKVRRVLGLLGLLGVVLAVAGPWRASLSDRAGDLFTSARQAVAPRYEPARPVAVNASSEATGHPATAAFDGATNTNWAENVDGPGEGATLDLDFDPPIDLGKIGLTSGDQSSATSFAAQPRPRTIEVTAGDATSEITLKDTADFQSFSVGGSTATRVTIRVTSVYPSPEGSDLSISEIELFARR